MARTVLAVALLTSACGVGAQSDPVALTGDPYVIDPRAVPAGEEAGQYARLHHELADAHAVQLEAWGRALQAERAAKRAARSRAVAAHRPPSPAGTVTVVATASVWDRLAACESGGNWSINTGNGYYGGLQFSLSSWRAVGGTGYPHEHSRETQIAMGERLRARQGWGAWPTCSRKLGLR